MANTERIFGWHAVLAALRSHPERVVGLWLAPGAEGERQRELRGLAEAAGVTVQPCGRKQLDEWAQGNHQGVVAQCRVLPQPGERELFDRLQGLSRPFLLVLDGVTDPHNLGACLRSADAAGAHAVIVPRDRSAGMTPVVRKVASGAAESLPLYVVTNLARVLDQLKEAGVWLVGAAGEAERTLYEVDLGGPLALLLGAEGKGLRRLTRERCDALVRIPMAGAVDSLNVSVAAGVCLFEARRQRLPAEKSPLPS